MKIKTIPAPKDWQHLTYHPLADKIGFGIGCNIEDMAEHMKANGYDENEPIVIFEDKILDGRHRHGAAVVSGITPTFARFEGKSPWEYVKKKAFRQHLTPSQIAHFVIENISHVQSSEASVRASANGRKTSSVAENSASQESRRRAAKEAGIDRQTANSAARVKERGTALLWDMVREGKVAASDAETVVILPPEQQNAALAKVIKGECKTIREAAGLDRPARLDKKPKQETLRGNIRIFNWRSWEKDWAWLKTMPERIAAAFEGEERSADYEACRAAVLALEKTVAKWRERLSKPRV